MTASTSEFPGRIFMKDRREDTAYPAAWLYDRLVGHFGRDQVFKDVDSIELGDDFVDVITAAVGSCDVLLALIGDRWLTVTDRDGRSRLDSPADFVRLEIEAALARNVRVIPILVAGAGMPRADELPASLAKLTRRQALELSPSRFDADTGRLLGVLDRALAEAYERVGHESERAARHRQQIEQPHAEAKPVYQPTHYDSFGVRQADARNVSPAKPDSSESILTVGLVGPSASGKTVLMRVLVKQLRDSVAQRFGADVRFATVTPGGHPGGSSYEASEEAPLYTGGILPAATPPLGTAEREHEIPVVLRWRQEVGDRSNAVVLRTTLISFNDTAGEDLVDLASVFRLHYLANCNALIITIDPFAIGGARALLKLPPAAIKHPEHDETVDVISRITELLRTELDVKVDQRIGFPVAVVVTKIDAFYSILDRQSPLIVVPRDAPAYDDSDGQLVHEQVHRLLYSWNAEDIDIHMRLNYSDYRYFAISALGTAPDYENGKMVPHSILAHRVEDPVLWLMSKYQRLDRM